MLLQFMNKVLYAREGAKGIMDRTFEDLYWQVRVEVDGNEIDLPEVWDDVKHRYTSRSLLLFRSNIVNLFEIQHQDNDYIRFLNMV